MDKKLKSFDDEILHKSDMEEVISVNTKAIELHTEISEQNEEVISLLGNLNTKMDKIIIHQDSIGEKQREIYKEVKDIERNQFKVLILLSTGIVSLIIQLISLLAKH
jgi:hypothetical protein